MVRVIFLFFVLIVTTRVALGQTLRSLWDYPTYNNTPFYKASEDVDDDKYRLDSSLVVYYSVDRDTVGVRKVIRITVNDSIEVVNQVSWGEKGYTVPFRITTEVKGEDRIVESAFSIIDKARQVPDYYKVTTEVKGIRNIAQKILNSDYSLDTVYNAVRGGFEYADGSKRKTNYAADIDFKPIRLVSVKYGEYDRKGHVTHFKEMMKDYRGDTELDSTIVIKVWNRYKYRLFTNKYAYKSRLHLFDKLYLVEGRSVTKQFETIESRVITDSVSGEWFRTDSFFMQRDEYSNLLFERRDILNSVCEKKYFWKSKYLPKTRLKNYEAYYFGNDLYRESRWFYGNQMDRRKESAVAPNACLPVESGELWSESITAPFAGQFQLLDKRGYVVENWISDAGALLELSYPKEKDLYTLIGFSNNQVCSNVIEL